MILSELKIVGQKECGPTEKLVPTKFGYKKILDKKDLVQKLIGEKKIGQKVLVHIFWVQNNFVQERFGPKQILVEKI